MGSPFLNTEIKRSDNSVTRPMPCFDGPIRTRMN